MVTVHGDYSTFSEDDVLGLTDWQAEHALELQRDEFYDWMHELPKETA